MWRPERILTTRDIPVYSEQILKIYYRIAKENPKLLPPTPLIHKSVGIPDLEIVQNYFRDNPQVEYIMVDGSHKTTALTLTGNLIHSMIIENDEDISEIRRMIERGEVFSLAAEDTILEILKSKAEHYTGAKKLQTVKEKTDEMIERKLLPEYMIR